MGIYLIPMYEGDFVFAFICFRHLTLHPTPHYLVLFINMTVSCLPDLPVVCLQTAQSSNTIDAFSGKNTVIGMFLVSGNYRNPHCNLLIHSQSQSHFLVYFRFLDHPMHTMPRSTRQSRQISSRSEI